MIREELSFTKYCIRRRAKTNKGSNYNEYRSILSLSLVLADLLHIGVGIGTLLKYKDVCMPAICQTAEQNRWDDVTKKYTAIYDNILAEH